jgi:hypothetical protein
MVRALPNIRCALAGLGPAIHDFFHFDHTNAFVDARAKPAQGGNLLVGGAV